MSETLTHSVFRPLPHPDVSSSTTNSKKSLSLYSREEEHTYRLTEPTKLDSSFDNKT